jgi:hypothetical protein
MGIDPIIDIIGMLAREHFLAAFQYHNGFVIVGD